MTFSETVTHVAGPVVTMGGRSLQRCACCGFKLRDSMDDNGPLAPDKSQPAFLAWQTGALIHLDGDSPSHVGDFRTSTLPDDFCLALVE